MEGGISKFKFNCLGNCWSNSLSFFPYKLSQIHNNFYRDNESNPSLPNA